MLTCASAIYEWCSHSISTQLRAKSPWRMNRLVIAIYKHQVQLNRRGSISLTIIWYGSVLWWFCLFPSKLVYHFTFEESTARNGTGNENVISIYIYINGNRFSSKMLISTFSNVFLCFCGLIAQEWRIPNTVNYD